MFWMDGHWKIVLVNALSNISCPCTKCYERPWSFSYVPMCFFFLDSRRLPIHKRFRWGTLCTSVLPGLELEQHYEGWQKKHCCLTGAVCSVTPTLYSTNATAVCLFAPMSRLCDTPLCCACLNCPTQLALISDSVRMSKHGVSNPSLCPPWRLAAHENPPKSTTPANRQRKPNASRFLSKQVPVKRQINDKSFEGVCRGNDFAHVSPLKNWLGPARSKYLNQ